MYRSTSSIKTKSINRRNNLTQSLNTKKLEILNPNITKNLDFNFQQRNYAQPIGQIRRTTDDCQVVVVTSGKGGVGKTTTAASLALGLADKGYKTCAIDFDIGLRNLDLHLGCERRVVYDFVNVIQKECKLHQAAIKDKQNAHLFLLAASTVRDKSVLTEEGVGEVIDQLRKEFDYVVCDSPAGIENGAFQAMYFADQAVICTNPEISSVRDSDRMIGIIASKSDRARKNLDVQQHLLITRYNPKRVAQEDMLNVNSIEEMLGIPLVGVVPECQSVLTSTNLGRPVIAEDSSNIAGKAYRDFVDRFLGEDKPLRFLEDQQESWWKRLFSRN
uniref:Mitochondrial MinD n=1 Tax=Pharyngomonas kirbyi TaxID=63601 RepID=A0A0E3SU92_9EUKA|nr:mitochondrial MinD [Pharyngomonas kirbyi]|eukprot:gb/GECH01000769.1/.p1 GENE.gb/GECH01000769.1/~~gb/GECH01000769.1/.p1  ORF type:complete len:331 (+),score=84.03 gb/GECH01000769.1/:1-993(+)